METTQIYTHVHIDALREVHTRCHPHGRFDADHDLYGLLTVPDMPEQDLPSSDLEKPLQPEAVMAVVASSSEVVTGPVAVEDSRRLDLPPDEDPPTGGAPVTSANPPPKGGSPAGSHPFPGATRRRKTSKSRGLRPRVAFYGYRWYDPLTGCWPSRDPIGKKGGINLYGFVENDVINKFELLGWMPVVPGPNYTDADSLQIFWMPPDSDDTIWGRLTYGFKITIEPQADKKCCLKADLYVDSGPNAVIHPGVPLDRSLITAHEKGHVTAVNNRIKEIEEEIENEVECYASENEASEAASTLESLYMREISAAQRAEANHDMSGGYGTPPPGPGGI